MSVKGIQITRVMVLFAATTFFVPCIAQTFPSTVPDEEIEYNRRLALQIEPTAPAEGYVPDPDTAIAIARAVAIPIYGKSALNAKLSLKAGLTDGVWTVVGSSNKSNCCGGQVVVQVDKKTGKILTVFHTQ